MFSSFLRVVVTFLGLLFVAMSASGVEINKDTYDIYLGDADDDGDNDFYFAQKPWVLILYGDISTPLLIPPTKNFIVYSNSGSYSPPQNYTMTATMLANKIASGKLRLAVFNTDYFVLNPTTNSYTLLLRGADEYSPGLLIKSYSSIDLPSAQDITTLSINSYDGISNRNIRLIVKDINRDGLNDISLVKNDGSEYAYVTDNNPTPTRFFEVTPSSIASIDKTRALPAEFDVTSSGQATYKIPVMTAPGSAGLVPNVSLNYSSGGGNGIAGLGWSLSAYGAISRCRQTEGVDGVAKPITWTSEDRFCLNGERLLLTSGAYGAVGSTYKTEIDSFLRVTAVDGTSGNPDYFIVEYKDGIIETYGNTTDSSNSKNQLSANNSSTVLDWALSKRSDSAGNKIVYNYVKDTDGQRIDTIDYAFGATSTRGAYLQFNYESRNDPISGYVAGHAYKTGKRLSGVRSYNGTNEIRNYTLTYNQGTAYTTNDKLSRVNKVQECVGSVCSPATEFEWEHYTATLLSYGNSLDTGVDGVHSYTFGDINGDGLKDILWETRVDVKFNVCTLLGCNSPIVANNSYLKYAFGSKDASGKISFVQSEFGAISGATNKILYGSPGPHEPTGSRSFSLVDYNLDGRQDLVYFASGTIVVHLSVPSSNGEWRLSSTPLSPLVATSAGFGQLFADVNGDGAQDIVGWEGLGEDGAYEGGATQFFVKLLARDNGSMSASSSAYRYNAEVVVQQEFNGPSPVFPGVASGINRSYSNYALAPIANPRQIAGDFNGDGQVDLIANTFTKVNCSTEFWSEEAGEAYPCEYSTLPSAYLLKTQVINGTTTIKSQYFGTFNLQNVKVADINGDGLSDVITGGPVVWYYQLSNGSAFNDRVQIVTSNNSSQSDMELADFNGDGSTDIIWHDKTTSANLIKGPTRTGAGSLKIKYWDSGLNSFGPDQVIRNEDFKILGSYQRDFTNYYDYPVYQHVADDIDSDGLVDIVRLPQVQEGTIEVSLADGSRKSTNKIVKIIDGINKEKKN